MLPTFTALCGLYYSTGTGLKFLNKHMVKLNMIYTLQGKMYLINPEIKKSGVIYRIYEEGIMYDDVNIHNKYYGKESGITFTMKNPPTYASPSLLEFKCGTKIIDTQSVDNEYYECLEYDSKLLKIVTSYKTSGKKIMIETSPIVKNGNIWYLSNNFNDCSIMAYMDKDEFKNYIITKKSLPWIKASGVIFLLLLFQCIITYF